LSSDQSFDYDTLIKLFELRQRFPYLDDRSVKIRYLSARCPVWLHEDFDFVCRSIEGEEPSVVLRRLVRDYISNMMIPLDKR